MKTVCILSEGEWGEGVVIISAHTNVNSAKRAAWQYVQDLGGWYPLMNWQRIETNVWRVISLNKLAYLEIRKVKVTP